jgi:hypothetical protein
MTTPPKTLHDAKSRIAELEAQLSGNKTLPNPYRNPGQKPTSPKPETPKNPKPMKPFGSAAKAIEAVNNVLSGRMSIDEAREAIKSAATIKDKLAVIGEVQANLRSAIEKCGNDMSAQAPLYKKLQAANEAEAYALLAEKVELGPRGAKAKTLLRRSGLE